MFLVWHGSGLFGLIPLILTMVGSAAASGGSFRASALSGGLTLAASGVGLSFFARHIDPESERDSLYWIPLWIIGIIYAVGGLALAVGIGYTVSQEGWGR